MSRKAGRYFKEAPSRSHPSHSTTQYSPYLTNSNPCEGIANGEDLRIESPTDFKHVIGISNETFLAIKSAEKELFVGMSHSQESLEDAMDLLGQSLNGNKPRLTVVQEREMHGGAFLLRTVEIIKHSDENIGIIIRLGNELDRWDGVFISQLVLGSMVETSGLIKLGDEILYVNGVDISGKDLDEVTLLLKIPSRLLITLKIRQVGKCAYRTRESRSASSSPRRFQSGRRTELMLGDYKSKTIPRPSSAQKHRDASGGKVSSTARQDSQDYHNNNCSVNNAQPPQGGAKAASRSRFRSATASEVLSGGSSSELSPRDTSTSERDLSPTFGPEICIAPDDDSDSVVFVDEETDAKNGSFNDFDGLRNSAPAGSTVLRKLTQQSRPKSTVIPPDQTLLEESRREEEAELNLRHVSSSDDIRKDGKHSGKGSDRDIPKMTRQTSIPGESPQSPRRDDQRLIRRKMAGISLDFSLFKMPQSAKINRSNFIGRKGSNPSQSGGQKYVPKPSPEKKKSRRISSNKPLDVDATQFIKYKGDVGTRARSPSPFSGILTLHLHGGRKMSTKKEMRDLYCVVEVDCVHKAQTCTICGHDEFCWDEKFEIDLEQSHCLGLMIYSYGSDSDMKQKLCYRTAVRFSNLFSQMRSKEEVHNLALRLDPRGTLYATLSFTERSATLKRVPSLDRRGVFGVHIDVVVRREGGEKNIPFIVQKCVQEVELRGLNSIGIYRVCGSAKKKKKLHDEFEKASALVDLNFDNYPDINIITGVLKDYLRELPEPLFTSTVCERLLELLDSETMSFSTEMILQAMLLLPTSNKDTAEYLLDHLKAVDAYSGRNKMNMYNIAVCFGPVLMSRGCAQAIANGNEKHKSEGVSRTQSVDSAEKHIELLHTLLDVWPARTVLAKGPPPDEEEPKPSEDPVVIDNQEEDSCYHSNDDLDESAPKDAVVVVGNGGGNEVEVEIKNPVEENAGWDADHLEVSAC